MARQERRSILAGTRQVSQAFIRLNSLNQTWEKQAGTADASMEMRRVPYGRINCGHLRLLQFVLNQFALGLQRLLIL